MVIASYAIIPKGAVVKRSTAPAIPGLGAVTVKISKSVLVRKVALMLDCPVLFPVARPVPDPTVATPVPTTTSVAVQVVRRFVVTSRVDPSLYIASAVYCWVPKAGIEASAGVTSIDINILAFTVKTAILLVVPPKVAVMFDRPKALPVARPVFNPIEATPTPGKTSAAAQLLLIFVVTSRVDPSLYIAVAVNCWVPKTGMEASAGATKTEFNVLATTFKTAILLVMRPKVAVMFDVPAVKPIAKPLIGLAATARLPEVQVMPGFAVTLRVDPSL